MVRQKLRRFPELEKPKIDLSNKGTILAKKRKSPINIIRS